VKRKTQKPGPFYRVFSPAAAKVNRRQERSQQTLPPVHLFCQTHRARSAANLPLKSSKVSAFFFC